MLNVDASPLVNVIVFKFTEAVINELPVSDANVTVFIDPVASVTKNVKGAIVDAMLVTNAPLLASNAAHLVLLDEVYAFKEEVLVPTAIFFVSCEAVNAFNELKSVGVPNEDVDTNVETLLPLPTQLYPCCKDAVNVPVALKLPVISCDPDTLTVPIKVCISSVASPNWLLPEEYITDEVSYKV